jgi:hypothetical protein
MSLEIHQYAHDIRGHPHDYSPARATPINRELKGGAAH